MIAAVILLASTLTFLAFSLTFAKRAQGKTTRRIYIPSLLLTLIAGAVVFVGRTGVHSDHPSTVTTIAAFMLMMGNVGLYSASSPSWKGLCLDDLVKWTSIVLIPTSIYSLVVGSHPGTNLSMDFGALVCVAIGAASLVRLAHSRSIDYPVEAAYLRWYARLLFATYAVATVNGIVHHPALTVTGMIMTSLVGVLIARYMMLRMKIKDFTQYQMPPRVRPSFSQYWFFIIAVGCTVASYAKIGVPKNGITLLACLLLAIAIIVRQAVTLFDYEHLTVKNEEREYKYRMLIHNALDGIVLADKKTMKISYVNPAGERLLGGASEELVQKTLADVFDVDLPELTSNLGQGNAELVRPPFMVCRGDLTLEVTLALEGWHIRATVRDATVHESLRAELHDMAYRDQLTGLPNRHHLVTGLEKLHKEGHARWCLFIDLDRFKPINDLAGHTAGDAVLTEVAKRIRAICDPHDMVGRLGGDEFLVVTADDPKRCATAIYAELRKPFPVADRTYSIGASIGIARLDQSTDPHDALRFADMAMYEAKREDRIYRLFTPSMMGRDALEADVSAARSAVDKEQFTLELSPIIDIASDQPMLVEGLLTWTDGSRSGLSRQRLHELMDDVESREAVHSWHIRAGLEALRDNNSLRLLSIAVPVTVLCKPGYTQSLLHHLAECGVDASRLVLELEGDEFTEHAEAWKNAHRVLTLAGVRFMSSGLDTSYNAMLVTPEVYMTFAKIDPRLTQSLDDTGVARSLLAGIARQAFRQDQCAIVTGVEPGMCTKTLQEMGATALSGHLIAGTVPFRREADYSVMTQWRSAENGILTEAGESS